MASDQYAEADSPYIPSNSIIPQTVLEDLCRWAQKDIFILVWCPVFANNDFILSFKSRFLINIPEEERKDVVRLCFQIETAHWFYVDFYRQEQPDLPACGLKDFTRINILL